MRAPDIETGGTVTGFAIPRERCPVESPPLPNSSSHLPTASSARANRAHEAAFTLAESLFAMAILSFALLTLLGFLPAGLGSLAAAERRIAEARIVHSIASEFEVTAWDQIDNLAARKSMLYFDSNGVPTAGGGVEVAYLVRLQLSQKGSTKLLSDNASDSFRRLNILIGDTPNTNSLTAAKNRANHDFSILLLHTGREVDE